MSGFNDFMDKAGLFAAKAAGYDERQESLKAQARLAWEREG